MHARASDPTLRNAQSGTAWIPLPSDSMTPWRAALLCWLALGCAALVFVPQLRGVDPTFGWTPFWLVIAPLIDLAVLRRRRLIEQARELFRRMPSRRRPSLQAKTRRHGRTRSARAPGSTRNVAH